MIQLHELQLQYPAATGANNASLVFLVSLRVFKNFSDGVIGKFLPFFQRPAVLRFEIGRGVFPFIRAFGKFL